MNQKTFNREMKVAEIQGDIREKRGLNWAYISLSLIALTIFITALFIAISPDSVFNLLKENSNAPGVPAEQNQSR